MKKNTNKYNQGSRIQKVLEAIFTTTLLGGLVISLMGSVKYPNLECIGCLIMIASIACAILFIKTENTAHFRCTQCKCIHIPDQANPLQDKQNVYCPVCNKITPFEKI